MDESFRRVLPYFQLRNEVPWAYPWLVDLVALVSEQMAAGRNQYAPMQGVLELREEEQRELRRRLQLAVRRGELRVV